MKDLIKSTLLVATGAAVGAAVALLLTPKTGEQVRKQIKDLAEDAKGRALELANSMQAQAQECCEQVRQRLAEEAAADEQAPAAAATQPNKEA